MLYVLFLPIVLIRDNERNASKRTRHDFNINATKTLKSSDGNNKIINMLYNVSYPKYKT